MTGTAADADDLTFEERGCRSARFRGDDRLRRRDQQPAFLLCRGRPDQARRLVPGRRDRLQPDPRRRHLSPRRLCAVAAGQRRSVDLAGDGTRATARRCPRTCAISRSVRTSTTKARASSCASTRDPHAGHTLVRSRSCYRRHQRRDLHQPADQLRHPPVRRRARQGGADLRRRPGSGMDAADPRHPEGRSTSRRRSSSSAPTRRPIPDLVQRMVDEGHEVGNHTYTHPNLADTPTTGCARSN